MAVESHIDSLKTRHEELDKEIKEMMASAAFDSEKLSDLKRRKLKIKDRISQLANDKLN